jgi:hypothetical protein
MAMVVIVESPDLDRQIELLKFYPEIARKHFKPALQASVALMDAAIRPGIPVDSGETKAAFGSKVTGTTISNLMGRSGWSESSYKTLWPINVVEYGSRAHDLHGGASVRSPKNWFYFEKAYKSGGFDSDAAAGTGQHVNVKGNWKTMRVHPGFAARWFLHSGFQAALPGIEVIMAAANEACVQDLVVR